MMMINKVVIVFALFGVYAFAFSFKKPFHSKFGSFGDVILVPHPLPCSYEITENAWSNFNGTTYAAVNIVHVHDTYFRYEAWGNGTMLNDLVIRSDISEMRNGTLTEGLFLAFTDETGEHDCLFQMFPHDYLQESYVDPILDLFTSNKTFEVKEQAVFQGKKCYVFYTPGGSGSYKVFVDYDNYIIGTEIFMAKPVFTNYTYSFEYKFTAPLSSFVINMDFTDKCKSEGYKAPTKKLCP